MGRKHLLLAALVGSLVFQFACAGRDDGSGGSGGPGGSGGSGGTGGTGGTGGSTWDGHTVYDLQDPAKGAVDGTEVILDDVIVTAVIEAKQADGSYAGQHFYVQEAEGGPYSGIYVRNGGTASPVVTPAPAVGDRVKVVGTLDDYFGNTQILLALVEKLGTAPVPAPARVDPEAVATGGADQEKYEGVLVEVTDVKVTERVVPGSDGKDHGDFRVNLASRDGGGLIVGPQATDYIRVEGDRLASIVGVMAYSFEEAKLVARANGDITFPDGKKAGELTEAGKVAIRDLQDWTSAGHPRAPASVELEGVTVTAVAGNRIWVQEAAADPRWSGILVMLASGQPKPAVGDRVDVAGIYTEYYDDSEVKDATVTITGAGTLPAPARVTPAEIRTGSPTAEAYEGVLVEVVEVQNVEDPVLDDQGTDRGDYRVAPIADPRKEVGVVVGHVFPTYYSGPAEGETHRFQRIVGVLDYSYNEFRLEPRSSEDITMEDGSHPVPAAIAVRDVQDPASPKHPQPNSGVVLEKVVVTAVTPGGSFFVADPAGGPYSGVYVYKPGPVTITVPAVGDEVTVRGVYKEYFDLTEIEVAEVTRTGTAVVPEPVVLAPDELAAAETAERYEGMLVAVENVQVTRTPVLEGEPEADKGSFRVQTVPGDGDASDDLVVGMMFGHAYTSARKQGDVFQRIVGVLDYSFELFRLQPRSNEDLTFADGTHPGQVVTGGLTVRDLQDESAANHPAPGTEVTLEGVVVTAVVPTGSFFVADPGGGPRHGIYAFKPGPVSITVPAVGDVVTVVGRYLEYVPANTTQDPLSEISVTAVQKTGTAGVPAPSEVTVAALLDPATAEEYEGCLVKVTDVEVTVALVLEGTPPSDKGAFRVHSAPDDNPDDDLLVDDMFAHAYVANRTEGDVFSSIVGVLDYSYGAYRLQPRSNADLTFADGTHPGPQAGLTIYDLQDPTSPAHPGNNATVTIEDVVVTGVVTAGSHAKSFFVADPAGGPYSGIYVYRPSGTFTPPAVGDVVTVTGKYMEFNQLSEIALASADGVTVTGPGAGTEPDPIVVTPDVLADPATAEPYEGCLVRVENVQVTVAPDSYGAFRVQAIPGDEDPNDDLYVDDLLYRVSSAPAVGTTYGFIQGLLDYSFDHFRLSPRGDTDLAPLAP